MVKNLENEVWKDCHGYEGFYQISNLGRVKSVERIRTNKDGSIWVQRECLLNGKVDRNGYRIVYLIMPSGRIKKEKVCRLVAICFVDNPNKDTEVSHSNSLIADDRAQNLRWVSKVH